MAMADLAPAAADAAAARHEDPDGKRTYPYPPTGEELWSVTTLISATDSKPWIARWHGKTSTAFCVDHLDQLARVLVTKGRDAAIMLGKDEAERIRSLKADVGVYVHDIQEALVLWAYSPGKTGADVALPEMPSHLEDALYDMGNEQLVPVPLIAEFMYEGFLQFVTDFGSRLRLRMTEMPVYNQPAGYAGTLDLIIELDGYAIHPDGDRLIACPGNTLRLCVDTKTGKACEGTWQEQLAAYRRAPECQPSPLLGLQPMPHTDAGAVLHLRPDYPDGYELILVAGDKDEAAWDRFLRAASTFIERHAVADKPGRVIRALREDGTMPGPRICDLFAEGYGSAFAPLRKTLGPRTELEELQIFTTADLLAMKGVGKKHAETIARAMGDYGYHLADQVPAGKAA
jgi:hypothetical protein